MVYSGGCKNLEKLFWFGNDFYNSGYQVFKGTYTNSKP